MAETASGGVLEFAAESNIGLHRSRNEDSFCLVSPPGCRNHLAAIADGVGGHADGDLASFLCCRRLLLNWRNWRMADIPDGDELERRMRETVLEANREIYQQNRAVYHTPPMCTTVVAAAFTPERVVVFHVGDSRFMLWRNERLVQITADHSLIRDGMHNVISRAVGPHGQLEVDMNVLERRPGDRYLLYSDGLSANLSDGAIAGTVAGADSPRHAVDRLMRAALLAGGVDNISVVCAFTAKSE